MKFCALLEVVPPKKTQMASMAAACKNWALLHPELARLHADESGLTVCRQYMYIELNREEGPRAHIMDRLYKRFSNLRREIETGTMAALLPEVAETEGA
jgi:hypothetical protein